MSVYIYEEGAFEKMVKVEGEAYRKCKAEKAFGECSLDYFKKHWDEIISKIDKCILKDNMNNNYTPGHSAAIYGSGGYNRYVVKFSGEIIFLTSSDSSYKKSFAKKAKNVGFHLSSRIIK